MHHVPLDFVLANDDFLPAQPPRRVFHNRKRLGKHFVERLSRLEARHKFWRFRLQFFVGKLLKFRFKLVDFGDDRPAFFDELSVRAPRENLKNRRNPHVGKKNCR